MQPQMTHSVWCKWVGLALIQQRYRFKFFDIALINAFALGLIKWIAVKNLDRIPRNYTHRVSHSQSKLPMSYSASPSWWYAVAKLNNIAQFSLSGTWARIHKRDGFFGFAWQPGVSAFLDTMGWAPKRDGGVWGWRWDENEWWTSRFHWWVLDFLVWWLFRLIPCGGVEVDFLGWLRFCWWFWGCWDFLCGISTRQDWVLWPEWGGMVWGRGSFCAVRAREKKVRLIIGQNEYKIIGQII